MVEPISIAAHALRVSPRELGDTAVVTGAGVIGLLILQLLRISGIFTIIVSDIAEDRLDIAEQTGATITVNPEKESIKEIVAASTGGRGADIVFDAVGTDDSFQSAVTNVRKGGTVTLIGNLARVASFPLQKVVTCQIRIQEANASGVTVNCLAPGWFETEQNKELYKNDQWVDYLTDRIPLKRCGEPLDLDGGISTGATKAPLNR